MEDPDQDLKATDGERSTAPDFDALVSPEELVRGNRTRDDFLDAVLGLDSPATIDEIANHADHGRDAAKEYLEWFDRMGIVTRVTDSPVTYERNQEYLIWRQVQQLREQYTTDDLLEFLQTETEQDEIYRETFDAESPETVSISAHAADTDRSIESVWDALSAWKTTRRRITLLERALASAPDGTTDRHAAA
ncbi:DUF7342 family protein [Halalkalicoccus ordinarius]|uniref:DUF7342 family protein n=1 Tax=Halalkalicoccus ordinarius TaxID=3116651 RepID=UPI00300E9DF4